MKPQSLEYFSSSPRSKEMSSDLKNCLSSREREAQRKTFFVQRYFVQPTASNLSQCNKIERLDVINKSFGAHYETENTPINS